MSNYVGHTFHLVDESPWPLASATGALYLTLGLVIWFWEYNSELIYIGLGLILIIIIQWWRDVSCEATFQGIHRVSVERGLRFGIILFIVSEILFFRSFFWTYYHRRLDPIIGVGGTWPPRGIMAFNPWQVPLLNTLILLRSGIRVTWRHHAIIGGNHENAKSGLLITIILGLYFTALQAFEYFEARFSIADRIYGRAFFVATGFHGLHVIVGTTFLLICYIRLLKGHFSPFHHFGFEAAAWYWHFVDVVWLFLFVSIYWWGGGKWAYSLIKI